MDSVIKIYVERNLGFEAEHHARDLGSMPGVIFHHDPVANRVGVLTTEATKHAMCGVLNSMLREHRIHVAKDIIRYPLLRRACREIHRLTLVGVSAAGTPRPR